MLAFLGTTALTLIEKELVNAEPEIEAIVIAQLEKLADTIKNWINSKVSPVEAVADDSSIDSNEGGEV